MHLGAPKPAILEEGPSIAMKDEEEEEEEEEPWATILSSLPPTVLQVWLQCQGLGGRTASVGAGV